MTSVATPRFWDLFHALPAEIQNLAIKNYRPWREDPHLPSLHFRRLKGSADRFSVRVGDHYGALGKLTAETVTRVWIGTHSEHDRLAGS